ncbi:MAG: excinuclease ABC subunit B [Planctomycetota bacterium]|nr:MAG: excinuclease ABC subunit B [Planctomycetota bacterium]
MSNAGFELHAKYKPAGSQPEAIKGLLKSINNKQEHQTLVGVTGSGKTFTVANVIAETNKPTLVISHNKTLAAQLFAEFKAFFPNNAVEYFVSYYDYYQPEAYLPGKDVYIAKDSSVNDELDRLRLAATTSLLTRKDVIIVSSVSCIYGLGSPEEMLSMVCHIKKDEELDRDDYLRKLVSLQYERNDIKLERCKFRARGDIVDVVPAYSQHGIRVEFFGDDIESITMFDVLTNETLDDLDEVCIYPAKQYIVPEESIDNAIKSIKEELESRLIELNNSGKILEAQRLESRTKYDMEVLKEVGFCPGIENYSRHFTRRKPGERPFCLFDFFPEDFLVVVDESHVTIPQVNGMYSGDRSRKQTLVDHGFRLPSALDNRPMKFDEFVEVCNQVLYISATPAAYELEISKKNIVQQIIRPTGLLDPKIIVRPAGNQVKDLLKELHALTANEERILVTALTKKMAEDISSFLEDEGIKSAYLHSEIKTLQRVEILQKLRKGEIYVIVGVNLLREGLDLPECTTVAIMDADKEGFLRSETSLLQTIGRAARNVKGRVILYADKITKSMKSAMDISEKRRNEQILFNKKNNITPQTIMSEIKGSILEILGTTNEKLANQISEKKVAYGDVKNLITNLKADMKAAAQELRFEDAARIRDRIIAVEEVVEE